MAEVNNRNALVTMAQFSATNATPYNVLGTFIEQVLYESTKTRTVADIRRRMREKFSINLEIYIVQHCLDELVRQKRVSQTKSGLFGLVPGKHEDLAAFEQRRTGYQMAIENYVSALIAYARDSYGQIWKYKEAYELLLTVLDKDHLVYDLIIGDRETGDRIAKRYAPKENEIYTKPNIVGRFVAATSQEESAHRQLLIQICTGLMLCANVFMMPEADTTAAKTDIDGTVFYFDTKMLLRTIGCGNEAGVEAANELVAMVQRGGGIVACYEITRREMIWALDAAIRATAGNRLIDDTEMQMYAGADPQKALTRLTTAKAALDQTLKSKNIGIVRPGSYPEADVQRYGFATEGLEDYLRNNRRQWNTESIHNDADILWNVQMEREADYTAYFGTSRKLPVFVTSNRDLARLVIKYPESQLKTPANTSGWQKNRLPLITDVWLTCRLWTPSVEDDRMGTMRLADAVVAACAPNPYYVTRIKEQLAEIQEQHPALANMPVTEFLSETVMDAVYEQADGMISGVTVETMTTTIEEMTSASVAAEVAKWQKVTDAKQQEIDELKRLTAENLAATAALQKQISSLQDDKAAAERKAMAETQKLIENAVESHRGDLPRKAVRQLKRALHWPFWAGLFGAAVGGGLTCIPADMPVWSSVFGCAGGYVLGMLLTGTDAQRLRRLQKADRLVGAQYDSWMRGRLLPNESDHAVQIIETLRGQHPLWQQCRRKILKLQHDG